MTYRPEVGEIVVIEPQNNEDPFEAKIVSIGVDDEVIGVERANGKVIENDFHPISTIVHTDNSAKQQALMQYRVQLELDAEDAGWPDDHMGEPDFESDAHARGCEAAAGDHTEELELEAAKQEARGYLEKFRAYGSDAEREQFVRSLQPDELGFFLNFSFMAMEERQFVIDIVNPVPNGI